MTITALSGPIVVYKDGGVLENTSANQNPDEGPSLFFGATGLLDPRLAYTFFPGMGEGPLGFSSAGVAIAAAPAAGWINATFQVADFTPGTATTTSIAATVSISSTTSLTLTATSVANITTNSSCTNPQTGAAVTGLWLIDDAPALLTFGQSKSVAVWDPAYPAIGRSVSITSTADVSSINFTVAGYDVYGNPITETLAGGTAATAAYTGKTFKWVASVASSTTSSNGISVGVGDIYGFPLYCSSVGYLNLVWDDVYASTNTTVTATFVAGSTVTTAGATDVRGTIDVSDIGASDGTKKMQLWMSVNPNNLATEAGLFGVTPA
jgi:hypothetical protein